MKKICWLFCCIFLIVVTSTSVCAEEDINLNITRGPATCGQCDRGTLYEWQREEIQTTTVPCAHNLQGLDYYQFVYLVTYRSCSNCSFIEMISREYVRTAGSGCLAAPNATVPPEVLQLLEQYEYLHREETLYTGIAARKAVACPACNGGALIEVVKNEDALSYMMCTHGGGNGIYDIHANTYRIHAYDCNKCNYRETISQEIVGGYVFCPYLDEYYNF